MSGVDAALQQIVRLCREVKPAEAQALATELVEGLAAAELEAREPQLRTAFELAFLKKRKSALLALLDEKLHGPAPKSVAAPQVLAQAEGNWLEEFEAALQDLSDRHIFQWSTYYRDRLAEDFTSFLDRMMDPEEAKTLLPKIFSALSRHADDIFQRGFNYQIRQGESEQYGLMKSLNGLQRFLDLPIEFYSTRLQAATDLDSARRLRALNSCMLSAIVTGYAQVAFGGRTGREALLENGRVWFHTLPFLVADDMRLLLKRIGRNHIVDGLLRSALPTVWAFDRLGDNRQHVPLPALSQFSVAEHRLDISLRPSTRSPYQQMIEVQCYLDDGYVNQRDLEEAYRRGVAAVVTPLPSDLRTFVEQDTRLSATLVAVRREPGFESVPQTRDQVLGLLVARSYRQGTTSVRRRPLQHNFANDFPLEEPFNLRYYRVHRHSVHDLLRTFESRNGVRLWCSVRRSGKTTAGFDLASTTGDAAVVSQTCSSTGELANDSVCYDRICAAVDEGLRIPATFFADLVNHCADGAPTDRGRTVFVLDEYESLFGELRSALQRDPGIRYTVVQPLLNQMVRFARENLLVFLGQQPDAHFILMEQNQLSPLVRQDAFPLFAHETGAEASEFAQFTQKVLGPQVSLDAAFVDAIYAETAGHPYLTVNLLRDFGAFLIEQQRRQSDLHFTLEDAMQFSQVRLIPSHISRSREYEFFRRAASQAMGAGEGQDTAWLRAVYCCLSEIVRASPNSMRCSKKDFEDIVERLGPYAAISADRLLSSATQSNFLDSDGEWVWSKIRLLGRIAAITQGDVNA
ncbi:hypothetical protein K4B79_14585 [Streptomyces lincolnensis]|uniref:hypothetical protein n=1 Tax=Streptomyces lincolnensis TaxID=1915 RepID=UPI001E431949|nr:hypothetical protein [Streptomyces lincolnensis]MCD7439455.1 hypothetical protein [Streptomyces lincolnensis]